MTGQGVSGLSGKKRDLRYAIRPTASLAPRGIDGRALNITAIERWTESAAACLGNHDDFDREPDFGTEHVL